MLEEMLEEIDALLVESVEDIVELRIQELSTCILDGGRSIRIQGEVMNVYDALAILAKNNESHIDS